MDKTLPRRLQVVVLTASTLAEAQQVDAVCRDNGVAFIRAETRGVFASVFTDFGPAFTVLDVDGAVWHCDGETHAMLLIKHSTSRLSLHAGEEPFTGIVAGITPGVTTLVTCVEDDRLEFQVRCRKQQLSSVTASAARRCCADEILLYRMGSS